MIQSIKFLAFSFCLFLGSGLFAQDVQKSKQAPRTPEQNAQNMTDKMTKELGLDEGQQKKVYDLNLKYAKEAHESKAAKSDVRQQQVEKHQARKAEREAELKTILTAEQYSKMNELQKQRQANSKAKFKERKEKSKGMPAPEKVTK